MKNVGWLTTGNEELKHDAIKMLQMLPLSFILSIVPDLVIAYGIVVYLGNSALLFWLVYLAILGLRVLGWIYRSTASGFMYWLYNKELQVNAYLRNLQAYKFPPAMHHHAGPFVREYYKDVSNDDQVPIETRLKARELYGYYEAVRQAGGRQVAQRQDTAMELALRRYKPL